MPLDVIIDILDQSDTDCGLVTTFKRRKERESVISFDYWDYVKSGKALPMNPYRISDVTINSPKGIWRHSNSPETTRTGSLYGCFGSFVDDNTAEAVAVAKAKAIKNFYGNLAGVDFNVSVAVGELPQTVNMIGSTARRLAQSFKSLKRLDIDGAFNALKMGSYHHRESLKHLIRRDNIQKGNIAFASDSWLEMTYGWKPLLSDVKASADAYNKVIVSSHTPSFRCSGSSTQIITGNPSYPSGFSGNGNAWGQVRHRIVAFFQISDQGDRDMQMLGLADPRSMAWELLPYSFVVDWFLPVGSFIEAMSSMNGLSLMSGCESTKISMQKNESLTQAYGQPASLRSSYILNSYERKLGLPDITGMLRPKSFSQALNIDKTITSMALLEQAFRK